MAPNKERDEAKRRLFMENYGSASKIDTRVRALLLHHVPSHQVMKQRVMYANMVPPLGSHGWLDLDNLSDKIRDAAGIGKDIYADWVRSMSQMWVIDGEWSQYHSMIASTKGWGLTQKQGMWEIVSVGGKPFASDDEARLHVLAAEADPAHEENTLAMIAINAIMVGNVRG